MRMLFKPRVCVAGKHLAVSVDIDAFVLGLLEQQRHIKTFNGDNPIEVLNGRYGPYLTFGGKNYRLPKAMHARAADLTLEECVEVIDAAEQKSEQKKK